MTLVISRCSINVVCIFLQDWFVEYFFEDWSCDKILFIYLIFHLFSCYLQLLATLFDMCIFHAFDVKSIFLI
jgi:hypothetical protein